MEGLWKAFGPYSQGWKDVLGHITDTPQTLAELTLKSGVSRQKLAHILPLASRLGAVSEHGVRVSKYIVRSGYAKRKRSE